MPPTFAIIIGISDYPTAPLPAAESDAITFARALIHWGIPESHVTLLTGKVDEKSLETSLSLLADKKEPFQLLFYFCGHGYRTKEATPESYLAFSTEKGYSLEELLLKIGVLSTTNTYLFIDACHLRLNLIFNPKLKEEVEGTLHSKKNLFCLFSSGIFPSYEDIESHYGYFTQALIETLSTLRKTDLSPSALFKMTREKMAKKELPEPEMYNIGVHQIDLFPPLESSIQNDSIVRPEVHAEIQDLLAENPEKNLWIIGEPLSAQLKIHSIPLPLNAPLEKRKRHELLLFEASDPQNAKKVIADLKKNQLRAIFFSPSPFRSPDYIEYHIPPLTDKELSLILSQEHGAPKNQSIKEEKRAMAAFYSAGFYIDEALFLKAFKIKPKTLRFLEEIGLTFYENGECHPRNCLLEFVESQQLKLNKKGALSYWKKQCEKLPNNIRAAQSLILTLKCFGYEPKFDTTLKNTFQILSKDLSTLKEGADIFFSARILTPSALYLAEILLEVGELSLTQKLLDIPSPLQAPLLKAHLLWRLGQFEKSLTLSSKEKGLEALFHQGMAHYFLGNWEEATQKLSEVKEKTSHPQTLGWIECLLGTINGTRGVEVKKSIQQIESGINHLLQSNIPEDVWVGWNNLGEIYLKTGRLSQATRHLEKALESAKKCANPNSFLEVARNFLELELQRGPKDLDWLDTIEKNLPFLSEPTVAMQIYNTLAKAYLQLKNPLQARPYIKKAFLLTAPSKAHHIDTLANAASYFKLKGLPQKTHHLLMQAQSLALAMDHSQMVKQLTH
ncbi:caspase family protein [Candidatus Neptunochlamydia vexilliferae]|nr:caspase family protein [Candidatus Neptunochlamydia vexilliferae]